MTWCGSSPDRIGHAIAALLPAETAADGPGMSRPRITVTTFVALSARRGARHCLAVFETRHVTSLNCADTVADEDLGTYSA